MNNLFNCVLVICLWAVESQCETERKFYISNSVSAAVCEQNKLFLETKSLQPPAKSAPASVLQAPDSCAWHHVQEASPNACGSSVVSTVNCDTVQRIQSSVPKYFKGVNQGTSGSARVINGEKAEPHEFPGIATVVQMVPGGDLPYLPFCAGSIIHPEWVLTAGHCLMHAQTPELYGILVGAHDVRAKDEANKKLHQVVQAIQHPGFSVESGENDVGLVRVDPPIELNDNVKIVTLPKPDYDIPAGTAVTLAGWGIVRNDTSPPQSAESLMKADLEIMDKAACKEAAGENGDGLRVMPGMICTNFDKDKKGGCSGDSGGPLYQIEGDVHTVVGAVSWTSNCHETPTVFSEVAFFMPWIQENTCGAVKAGS